MPPSSSTSDPLIGRSLRLNGKVWTIESKFEGIDYYYLVCEDEKELILRAKGLLVDALGRLGLEVSPN